MLKPARDEIVSRAFRRGFCQDRRFNFPEPLRVHVIADSHCDAMAHAKRFLHLRAAQIQISIFQTQLFRGSELVFDRKWSCFGFAEDPKLAHDDFDFARFQIWVLEPFAAHTNAPAHGDHELRSQRLRSAVKVRVVFGIKNDLADPVAIAQIDEDQLAMIAPAIDPAHQQNVLSLVRSSQGAACMSLLQMFHYSSSSRIFRCSFVAMSRSTSVPDFNSSSPIMITVFAPSLSARRI